MTVPWSQPSSWTVLDTGFGAGHHFLQIRQSWRAHAEPPALLHYVAVLSAAEAAALPADTLAVLAQPGLVLEPGFHRILLEDGKLSLTLCVGDVLEVLPRQEMQADMVLAAAAVWDKWQLKALARCCRRGTQLVFGGATVPSKALLSEAGFVATADQTQVALPMVEGLQAVYEPHWVVRRQRTATRSSSPHGTTPGRCAVIGGGLAGASVAQALARRGWQVDVHEAGGLAASGASGLPLGLVVPHHSVDDSPRSRLSRVGTRLMLAHAQRLLQSGEDWQLSGVLERHVEPDGAADLWHPFAAWIKPAQLIQRWLDHTQIRLLTHSAVHSLDTVDTATGRQWRLRNAQGQELGLGLADHVVFANAYGSVDLLQRLATSSPADFPWLADLQDKLHAMQVLHGTLSMGAMPTANAEGLPTRPEFPEFPVNGHGSFVCGVPSEQGPRWYTGATFRTDAAQQADLPDEHAANQTKLSALLPAAAQALSGQFANGEVQAWQGSRCVSHDRLPLVGPLTVTSPDHSPTLWICAGMGARGLSFSALCAELLAAWMGYEPLPVENTLARSLSSTRPRRKRGD